MDLLCNSRTIHLFCKRAINLEVKIVVLSCFDISVLDIAEPDIDVTCEVNRVCFKTI